MISFAAMLAVGSLALIVMPAQATVTGGAFYITAQNDQGDAASIRVALPFGTSPWVWESTEEMEMRSPVTGHLIAILNPQGRHSRAEYVDDPVVGMNFSVQAGPSPTTFNITSALLSFTPMDGEARITAGFSVTDADGDGATLTGLGNPSGTQGAYLAQYNGFAGTISGTTFAEEIHSIQTSAAFTTAVSSIDLPPVGFTTIPIVVSDMSVMISFELTPNDLAAGTSSFVIQPPPLSTEMASWGGIKGLYR
jgi:hypothetical protein